MAASVQETAIAENLGDDDSKDIPKVDSPPGPASDEEDDVTRDRSEENSPEGPSSEHSDDEDSIGHRLLLKQGWKEGQGLGKELQGRVDPLPLVVKDKYNGFGDVKSEVSKEDESTEKRRPLECEKENTEQLQAKYRENQEKERQLQESLADLKSSYHCELCDKQYLKHSDWDNHINSYDHAHVQRLKELKQKEQVKVSSNKHKDEKQLEKDMLRINEYAQSRAQKEHEVLVNDSEPNDSTNITVFFEDDAPDAPPLPPNLNLDCVPLPKGPTPNVVDPMDVPLPPGLPPPKLEEIILPSGPPPNKISDNLSDIKLPMELPMGDKTPTKEDKKEEKVTNVISPSRSQHVSFSFTKKLLIQPPANKLAVANATAAQNKKRLATLKKNVVAKEGLGEIKEKVATEVKDEKYPDSPPTSAKAAPALSGSFVTFVKVPNEDKKKKSGEQGKDDKEDIPVGDVSGFSEYGSEMLPSENGDKEPNKEVKQENTTPQSEKSKKNLLLFEKVTSTKGTELEWPGEMIQHTNTEPTISFSTNPLSFDFAALMGIKPKAEPEVKKKEKKKKKKRVSSSKAKSKSKKKKDKKRKSKDEKEIKEGAEGGKEEEKEQENKEKDENVKPKKKKNKKRKGKKRKAKSETESESDDAKEGENQNANGEAKKEKPKTKSKKKKRKPKKTKKAKKSKKSASETESENEVEKEEKKSEEEMSGSASDGKKKRKYRKRENANESSDSEAEEETKKKKKKRSKKKKRHVESENSSDDEAKPTKKKRKRKNSSKNQASVAKTEGVVTIKPVISDAQAAEVAKLKKMKADAAQKKDKTGSGRVSDFEQEKPEVKNDTAKSKWDTSSDSELEEQLIKAKKAKVQATPTKSVDKQSSVRSTKDESIRSNHTHRSEDRQSKREHVSDRSRHSSAHSYTSDDRSTERSYRSDSTDYRSRSRSYSTESDYSRRSYSRSRRDHSYSSSSDDYYHRRSRSRSYSRSRRSRSYSRSRGSRRRRSYTRSYTRSRSRSYSRSRRSRSRSRGRRRTRSPYYRREMKPSPDEKFRSVLPKKEPKLPRKTDPNKEHKTFQPGQLVVPVPTVGNSEEVTAKAEELLKTVKDKKGDHDSSKTTKGSVGANVPSNTDKGAVLPIISKMPNPPARKVNLLDGVIKLPPDVAAAEAQRQQKIRDILAKQMEAQVEEIEKKIEKESSDPANIPPPPDSSIPLPPPGAKKSGAAGAKEFIGPTLPKDHPLASSQEIPLPTEDENNAQNRFQPIGPNDPLVFSKVPLPPLPPLPVRASQGKGKGTPPLPPPAGPAPPLPENEKDGDKKPEEMMPMFIPPEQQEEYKGLVEEARRHIKAKKREQARKAGLPAESSSDEEPESTTENAEELVYEGQEFDQALLESGQLIPQPVMSPHLQAMPIQVPMSMAVQSGMPVLVNAHPGMQSVVPQAGAPVVLSSAVAAQAQAQAALNQQVLASQQAAQLQAAAAAGGIPMSHPGLVHASGGHLVQAGAVPIQASAQQIAQIQQMHQIQQIQQAQAQQAQLQQIQQAQLQQAQLQQLAQLRGLPAGAAFHPGLSAQPQLMAATPGVHHIAAGRPMLMGQGHVPGQPVLIRIQRPQM